MLTITLQNPKAINYCELNVFEHDKIDDDGAIASIYHFGDNDIVSLEDFLFLKNDNLSNEDRIIIFNVCKEINLLMLDKKTNVDITENVLDKWRIVEEIFTKSNNKNSA